MDVIAKDPAEEYVLQCALQLDAVNQFICSANKVGVSDVTMEEINNWKDYLFSLVEICHVRLMLT